MAIDALGGGCGVCVIRHVGSLIISVEHVTCCCHCSCLRSLRFPKLQPALAGLCPPPAVLQCSVLPLAALQVDGNRLHCLQLWQGVANCMQLRCYEQVMAVSEAGC